MVSAACTYLLLSSYPPYSLCLCLLHCLAHARSLCLVDPWDVTLTREFSLPLQLFHSRGRRSSGSGLCSGGSRRGYHSVVLQREARGGDGVGTVQARAYTCTAQGDRFSSSYPCAMCACSPPAASEGKCQKGLVCGKKTH